MNISEANATVTVLKALIRQPPKMLRDADQDKLIAAAELLAQKAQKALRAGPSAQVVGDALRWGAS